MCHGETVGMKRGPVIGSESIDILLVYPPTIFNIRWYVIQDRKGRFHPRVENGIIGSYWPYSSLENGYDTLEDAKEELIRTKQRVEADFGKNKETVVFELT